MFDWASLIVAVAGAVIGGGDSGVQEALQQVLAAVEASKIQILNHIDGLANAEVQACVRQHTIELADIENMSPTVRQLWAQEATSCATLATEYLNAVQNPAIADNLGYLIGEIHAIAIVARARARFSITGLLQNQISGYENLITKLKPTCTVYARLEQPDPWTENLIIDFYCRAYNGDDAFEQRYEPQYGELDLTWLEDEASRNTSRAVAKAALPKLREALAMSGS